MKSPRKSVCCRYSCEMKAALAEEGWTALRGAINLKPTLSGGQSFRWRLDEASGDWIGVVRRTVWRLRQVGESGGAHYRIVASLDGDVGAPGDAFHSSISKYFRCDVDLEALYERWSGRDARFAEAAERFAGVRMLAQEPVENLFSFICSSNNHISRISSMIEKLCVYYGDLIHEENGQSFYSFPAVQRLCDKKLESHLRELGFGYRAKFIHQSALKIDALGGSAWFESLQAMPYEAARAELVKLPGVGPKVADCVCLMSLGHLDAIPVDTHVFQIAVNNYLPHLRGAKSVTAKIYHEIGEHFRDLYGAHAGWAHTVLFCADLKKFEDGESKRISSLPSKVNKKKKCKRKT